MKLQNKIIISLLFFIVLLFFTSFGNVFASVYVTFTGRDGNEHTVPDFYTNEYDYSQGYVLSKVDNTYYLFLFPSDCNVMSNKGNIYNFVSENGYTSSDCYRFVLSDNGQWVYEGVNSPYANPIVGAGCLIWNSFDIYSRDKTSIIFSSMGDFFHQPVTEVTIPALEAVEQIPGIMTTILKIVLPIGLIVLGIGLVISVVKSVICRHL